MTDQTPSTEDVRYGYRTGVTAPILPVEAGDAFDAWLAVNNRETLREAAADLRRRSERVSSMTQRGAIETACNYIELRADRIGACDE